LSKASQPSDGWVMDRSSGLSFGGRWKNQW
jgi:hypothetical protein